MTVGAHLSSLTDTMQRIYRDSLMKQIFGPDGPPPPHPDGPLHGPWQWEVPDGMVCPCCGVWIDLSDRGYDW